MMSISLSPRPERLTMTLPPAGQFLGMIKDPGQGMGRFQGGQDALCLGEALEGGQGASVADHAVLRAAGLLEVGVLGADAGIVKAGGHGVRGLDLAFGSLQEKRAVAVKDAGEPRFRDAELKQPDSPLPAASAPIRRTDSSPRKPRKMPMALEPPPTQATTASGSLPVCSRICFLASLPTMALELGDQFREGSRACGCAEAVVGGSPGWRSSSAGLR